MDIRKVTFRIRENWPILVFVLVAVISFIASKNPYRLHREGVGYWEKFGIESDYEEWKITREEYKTPRSKDSYLKGVWRAEFRNTTDKKKQIWITFELLDRDNFVICSNTKGHYFSDAIYLSAKENRVIEGSFTINKKMASSAYKSQLRLSAEDIEEFTTRTVSNWRKLKKGMTQDQVRAILGEPKKIDASWHSYTYWYYSDGKVIFYEDYLDGWREY